MSSLTIPPGVTGTGTDNHLARWDGTADIQDSLAILDDSGNLTGTTSISMGHTTWDNLDKIVGTRDFTLVCDLDLNLISNTGNVNIIAIGTGGQCNLASDGDCTFGSASGGFILTAATDINLTATSGNIIANSNVTCASTLTMGSNVIKFGSGNEGSISHDATSLLIKPQVSGTHDVVIGSSSASGGNDANLRVGKLSLSGSDISATSIVNFTGSTTARTALNFSSTYTGSASSAGSIICTNVDQGTGVTFTLANVLSQTKLSSTSHTTNYTQYGFRAELGIDSTIVTSTGFYQLYGYRSMPAQQGVGNASTSGGTFYRVGFFQDAITAIAGTPTADKFVGGHFRDALSIQKDSKLLFDSDIALGNNPSGTTFTIGTTSLSYVSASSLLRMQIAGTSVFDYTTTSNNCLVDMTMTDAKNIIVGSTTGTKIGTATTQKIGFYNKTPVVQPSAYTPTNVTTDRSYNANATTLDEIADVLGTLVADLQSLGLVG